MASERPPSLGDSKGSGFTRLREQAELPAGRELILAELNRILGIGYVQKLVVEVGKPIVYERLVKSGEPTPDLEKLEADDLYGAIRNNEIIDFSHGVGNSLKALFLAFRFLTGRRLAAKALVASDWAAVRRWLGLSENEDIIDVFGVKTTTHEAIPDDVIVLVACDPAEPDVVVLSLRIPLDVQVEVLRKGKKS